MNATSKSLGYFDKLIFHKKTNQPWKYLYLRGQLNIFSL